MTTVLSSQQPPRASHPREWGPLLIWPVVLLVGLVQILPALYSLWASLRDIRYYKDRGYIGPQHFQDLLADPDTWSAVLLSIVFTVASLALAISLALGVALLVRRMGGRGMILATLVLIPWAMSPVAVALLWKWLLAPFGGGFLSTILAGLGLGPVSVLADGTTSMLTLIFVTVWRNFAFAALVLTAGLSQIPRDLYRASSVDGAGALRQFRRITIPLLRPSLLIAVTVLTISYFNEVQVIIGLTGGGPAGATTTISYELYQTGFAKFDQGRANAIGVIMFVVNVLLLLVLIGVTRARRPETRT